MKILVTAMIILVSLNSMAATTLLKARMVVAFAPPESRGVYTTSILSTGVVQHENNKGEVTQVMKISKEGIKNLQEKIAKLEIEELQGDNEAPACMDAPSFSNVVVKNGKEITIKSIFTCREKNMLSAYELNSLIDSVNAVVGVLLNK